MFALALLWALLAPALLGWAALRALGLRWRDDPLGVSAWGCMLGCLALGALLQAALELGIASTLWWLLPLPATAFLLWLGRRRAPAVATHGAIGRGYVVFVLLGCVLALLFVVAGMDRPCLEGDEGNIWSLKAKSLLVDWPAQFAANQVYNLHPDYPQLNPLLQVWIYALTDAVDFVQFENRWLVQLCDVALFVAVAAALRHRLRPLLAAPLATLLLLEPEFHGLCRTAYADGMVALGLVVALDAFWRWQHAGDRRFGWLAAAALAFALWSKNETMLYVVAAVMATVLTRRWQAPRVGGCTRRNLRLLVPAACVVVYTAISNRRFGMKSDLLGANPTGKSMFTLMAEQWPERVPALLGEALRLGLDFGHCHVVFAALALGAVLMPRRVARSALAMPICALAAAFVGLHVVYVGSFLPLRFHLDTSYTRVLFQIVPATILALGALLAEVVQARASGHTAPRP